MNKLVIPLSFAVAGLLSAQKTLPQAQSEATNPAPRQPHSERAQRSLQAGDLLAATNEARVAVESQNKRDADFHLSHAIETAKTLMQSPNGRFVTLYDELDRYSVLGPITSQRNQTGSAGKGTVGVREVTGEDTTAGLDVQAAQDHLQAAQKAVDQGEWQRADAALAAVQNGVVVTSVTADLPLLRARENLILARDAAENAEWTESQTALISASNALREYENTQGQHVNEARILQSQIDMYNRSIQKTNSDAVTKIDSWWDEVADWMTASKPPQKG